MISLFPTRIGNIRIRIEDTGVRYMKITQDNKNCDFGNAYWQDAPSLSVQARDQLIQLIRAEGFLTLSSAMINEMAVDGFREEIEVTLDEIHHQVAVQNTSSRTFDKVKQVIRGLIPFQ